MRLGRASLGALLGVIVGAAVISAGAITAGANGSTTASFAATVTVPVPPSSNFAGSGGGDGWGVALSNTQVFNIFHHQTTMTVACHEQADATSCWSSPKTITDGSGNNFATSITEGMYLDQSTGFLYAIGTRTSDDTGGVVCINTTLPAADTGAQLFCGFTALTAVGDAPLDGGSNSGLSDPVQVGQNWYIENEVAGTSTGTENQMLCFNLVSDTACASQPYSVGLGSPAYSSFNYSWPMGATGTQLISQTVLAGLDQLHCFDTTTDAPCAGGSWPVTVTSAAGAPFPLLSATGTVLGVCDPISPVVCFDPTGASVAVPPGLSAITGSIQYNGTAVVIGARVYIAEAGADQVFCYDYDLQSACANFPKSFSNLSLLYSVNPDPQRPTCIWVNADSGADQIQNFDAYTGGSCGAGSSRVLSSNVVVPLPQCAPSNYNTLQILSPPPSAYTGGTVAFDDFDGNPLSTPTATLDSTGSVDLAPLDLTAQSTLPQFLITLPGASAASVQVRLTWTGADLPECGASVSAPPPGHSAIGYRLQGHDGGVFDFGQSLFLGSLPQTQIHGLVGSPIEATANTWDNGGYWLAASNGGVFTFGDAPFFGSLAGKHLVAPIVGVSGTTDMGGYWLAAADGGVFAFGDAAFYGSLGGKKLNAPIVGMAATPDSGGYWLVASDGGVFAFGDAAFYGSLGGKKLNAPIVGMAATPDGGGYWLVAADGGVFAFGDAAFYGSTGGKKLNAPVVAMVSMPDGGGYWLMAADGGVFAFGDAPFLGSATSLHLNQAITSASS
jgi:hypothetical protein